MKENRRLRPRGPSSQAGTQVVTGQTVLFKIKLMNRRPTTTRNSNVTSSVLHKGQQASGVNIPLLIMT